MNTELLHHIEMVAWDEDVPEVTRLEQIQGLLYQAEQMRDRSTERQFGSDQLSKAEQAERGWDDTPSDHWATPNMRRV